MSIFDELHRSRSFGGWQDYNLLLKKINAVVEQGLVVEIKPSTDVRHGFFERWFVEQSSGVIFRLVEPDPPAVGDWSEVEFQSRPQN